MRILWSVLSILFIALSSHSWAANFDNPVDGIYKGAYGHSIFVQIPSLVNRSPDSNSNQPGELSLDVNADTAFTNFHQLTDLKVGDQVRVAYTQDLTLKTKNLVATSITAEGSQGQEVATAPVVNTNYTTTTPSQSVTTVTTTTTNQ